MNLQEDEGRSYVFGKRRCRSKSRSWCEIYRWSPFSIKILANTEWCALHHLSWENWTGHWVFLLSLKFEHLHISTNKDCRQLGQHLTSTIVDAGHKCVLKLWLLFTIRYLSRFSSSVMVWSRSENLEGLEKDANCFQYMTRYAG